MLKKFFDWLFKRTQQPAQIIPLPTKPQGEIPRPTTEPPDLSSYTMRALEISQDFEGEDPWANITGNFDGAGLTCGALGWTIQWDNQQRLVRDFVAYYGEDRGLELMPKTWKEYWEVCQLRPYSEAIRRVSRWSDGAKVEEPYNSELREFWKSEGMKKIQVTYAKADMGKWAWSQMRIMQAYFKDDTRPFKWFAFWFDQAVLNGTGKASQPHEAESVSIQQVWDWMASETGYGIKDFRNNRLLWMGSFLEASPPDITLLKLAYLRAIQARAQFDTITMNRRGTIAMGVGYVNGSLYDLREKLK